MFPSTQRHILDHWNALADRYDQAKARNAAYYRSLQGAIAEALPSDARQRILEVGCGTGQILASLRPNHGLGIDLSGAMIERARLQFAARPELEFRELDAVSIGELGTFTAAVSADLLEHVPDWPAVVRAMVRATEPGGFVIIATPNPLWAPALWALEKLRLKMPEGPHQFVQAAEIRGVLNEVGCEIEQFGTHGLVPTGAFGLGPAVSRWAARQPVLKRLGVIQLIVARAPRA